MATITRRIGPSDHGQRLTLDEFIEADFEEGWLYELARGVDRRDRGSRAPITGGLSSRLADLLDALRASTSAGVIELSRREGSDVPLRLPGMQSDRHPDQAVYLDPDLRLATTLDTMDPGHRRRGRQPRG